MKKNIRKFAWVLAIVALILVSLNSLAEPPRNYKEAKSVARCLWLDMDPNSFYCECPFRNSSSEERDLIYENRNQYLSKVVLMEGSEDCYIAIDPEDFFPDDGANINIWQIEFEHIVPQSWIVNHYDLQSISDKEKKQEVKELQDRAKGDLFNLVPVIGKLNNVRRNNPYGEFKGIPKFSETYGKCDFVFANNSDGYKRAQPAGSIRGDLARATLYMFDKYELDGELLVKRLHEKYGTERKKYLDLMMQWANDDPVDCDEKMRHDRVAKKMKNKNKFVTRETGNLTCNENQ